MDAHVKRTSLKVKLKNKNISIENGKHTKPLAKYFNAVLN